MSKHDRFSVLKPQGIIATLASADERFRAAFRSYEEATAHDVSNLRVANGSILDEVATTVTALDGARAALEATAQGGFPEVPATVLGLEPLAVVIADGTVEQHLVALDTVAAQLIEILKEIPLKDWGLAAHADDQLGHGTIEEIAQQTVRVTIESLQRIEAVTRHQSP